MDPGHATKCDLLVGHGIVIPAPTQRVWAGFRLRMQDDTLEKRELTGL